jgi:hypothetical protein
MNSQESRGPPKALSMATMATASVAPNVRHSSRAADQAAVVRPTIISGPVAGYTP